MTQFFTHAILFAFRHVATASDLSNLPNACGARWARKTKQPAVEVPHQGDHTARQKARVRLVIYGMLLLSTYFLHAYNKKHFSNNDAVRDDFGAKSMM